MPDRDEVFTLTMPFLMGGFALLSLFISWYFMRDPVIDAIPTVGFSDPILSYFSALQYYFDGVRMLRKGYKTTRTGPGLFKIATFRRWVVMATGSQLIDDIRRAPNDVLSSSEQIRELLQSKYTLDLLNEEDDYHVEIVRSQLTRNIANSFKEVHEELIMAMNDLVPICEDKWVTVSARKTIQRVICRVTNRIFVGAPLCRNHDYQDLNLSYAANVRKFSLIIGMFPRPLKFIVSRMLSNLPSQIRQETEFIRPIVEERLAKMKEYGEDWDDKPNDMLMWLMTAATGVEKTIEGFARRLLVLNFGAIHTTSMTLTQVLYRLLSNPKYLEPLREEVDVVIKEEGWTKVGIDKMYKVDSFVRETLRIDGITIVSVSRLTMCPMKSSNGTTIPAGTVVSIPTNAIHTDEITYPNPGEFDGFRFARLREDNGDKVTNRYQSTTMSGENTAFGLGRRSCPGRYFAINEINTLFAHIVATYDIKLEEGKEVPGKIYISGSCFQGDADLMFRARKT